MAMTPLLLAWLGTLAAGVTFLGLFVEGFDRWTHVLLTFLGSALWGIFGMGAMSVVVTDGVSPPVSEPVWMLVYPGIGIAALVALYGMFDLVVGAGDAVGEQSESDFF